MRHVDRLTLTNAAFSTSVNVHVLGSVSVLRSSVIQSSPTRKNASLMGGSNHAGFRHHCVDIIVHYIENATTFAKFGVGVGKGDFFSHL